MKGRYICGLDKGFRLPLEIKRVGSKCPPYGVVRIFLCAGYKNHLAVAALSQLMLLDSRVFYAKTKADIGFIAD